MLKRLHYRDRVLQTQIPARNELVRIEAFSDPLVVSHIDFSATGLVLQLPYGVSFEFELHPKKPEQQIYLDEWDRFHGFIEDVPFVFSRNAQNDFFNGLESFDDESFVFNGHQFETKPWHSWAPDSLTAGHFRAEDASNSLRDISAQIKLNRCRVAVFGLESDADFFSAQGHLVTHVRDPWSLGENSNHQFDVVFDHGFFNSISVDERRKVAPLYKRLLAEGGYLLGVYFILNPAATAPFGLTEWELREYLKQRFSMLYWTRWKKSTPERIGTELMVYAQIKA